MDALRRFSVLARALTETAAVYAARRAVGFYGGVAAVSMFLFFPPMGLRATDVARAAGDLPLLRAGLWLAWLVAAAPVARQMLVPPGTMFLRALPVPRWQFRAVHLVHLFVAHAPWVLLWARGLGLVEGLAYGFGAAAAHAIVIGRIRRVRDGIAAAALLAVLVPPPNGWVMLAVALPVAWVAVGTAWQRAFERGVPPTGAIRSEPAYRAVARTYLRLLWRAHGSAIARGGVVTLLGAGMAILAIRNNEVTSPISISCLSLGFAGPLLALSTSTLAIAVQRFEIDHRWLFDATGLPERTRQRAIQVSVGIWASGFALTHALVVAWACQTSPSVSLRLITTSLALGVAMGLIAVRLARRAEASGELDTSRMTRESFAAAAMVGLLVGFLREWGLAGAAGIAFQLSRPERRRWR